MRKVPVYLLSSGQAGADVRLVKVSSVYVNSHLHLDSAQQIFQFAKKHLYSDMPAEEYAYMIGVNNRSMPIAISEVSHGTVNMAPVRDREVLIRAFLMGASAFILVHNHVSGDPRPSHEDKYLTWHLDEISRSVGIPLLDHVVISDKGFKSVFAYSDEKKVRNTDTLAADIFGIMNYKYDDLETIECGLDDGTIRLQFPDGKWKIEVSELPGATIL